MREESSWGKLFVNTYIKGFVSFKGGTSLKGMVDNDFNLKVKRRIFYFSGPVLEEILRYVEVLRPQVLYYFGNFNTVSSYKRFYVQC